MAKGTYRATLQVDRRAAARAGYRLDAASQLLDLARRERANEILFLEELEKTNEVSVLVRTLPVGKTDVSGHIVRQRQRGSTSRTQERRRERWLGR